MADLLPWPVLPLEPDVVLRVTRPMPPLDPAIDAAVERHWRAACRRRTLFNGRVFCADRVNPAMIEGHWTEYRRVVAQMADPRLFATLGVRSLAVCGVVAGPDGVVVGRREPNATYQAGLWQLPPAGSVDDGAATTDGASWRRAILAELREELGVAEQEVGTLRPLCIVQHPAGVLDMGVHIPTRLDGKALTARHQDCGDREYDRLLVAPASSVAERVAALGGALVPSAAVFLAASGLL